MVLVPSAPVSLANNLAVTLATQIGLTWLDGASNGGTQITEYEVWYDEGNSGSTMKLLISGLTSKSHTATGLTQRTTYTFKVAARNSVGVSLYSDSVSILAAQIPDVPAAPLTQVIDEDVEISWTTALYDGGSPITAYTV